MKAKQRTQAQVREDCLVYDKPVTLQHYAGGIWQDTEHLHANINKAIGAERPRFVFRIRHFPALEDVRGHPQCYRLLYFGDCYEIADYDDFNERHRVIKLTAGRMHCGTLTLIARTETLDSIRQPVMTEQERDVFCEEDELTHDDRIAAQQQSLSSAYRVRAFATDYNGEDAASYNGRRYQVYKTVNVSDMIELYLGERIGDLRE
jgi:hypothetical protein